MTPQLALRVAIVGSIVLALFAIMFFRLWFLQVLTGSQYVAQAQVNKTRIGPDRGRARRDPRPAATPCWSPRPRRWPSRSSRPSCRCRCRWPTSAIRRTPTRSCTGGSLHVLHMPSQACRAARSRAPTQRSPAAVADRLRRSPSSSSLSPYAYVTIKPRRSPTYLQYYIAERQNQLPRRAGAADLDPAAIRTGPGGADARQRRPDLATRSSRAATHGRQAGRRSSARPASRPSTTSILRGTDGTEQVKVNALGSPTGQTPTKQPVAGHNLQTSLDAQLQRVGQQALAESVGTNAGAGGAFVAMNPENGDGLRDGVQPIVRPDDVHPQISAEATTTQLTSPERELPAAQPRDPVGRADRIDVQADHRDGGAGERRVDARPDLRRHRQVLLGADVPSCRHNAGGAAYGPLDLVERAQGLRRRLLLQPRRAAEPPTR